MGVDVERLVVGLEDTPEDQTPSFDRDEPIAMNNERIVLPLMRQVSVSDQLDTFHTAHHGPAHFVHHTLQLVPQTVLQRAELMADVMHFLREN